MKITIDSKIKEIIEDKSALGVIEKNLPGFSENTQLKMAYNMTLRSIAKIPQSKISPTLLAQIETELNAI